MDPASARAGLPGAAQLEGSVGSVSAGRVRRARALAGEAGNPAVRLGHLRWLLRGERLSEGGDPRPKLRLREDVALERLHRVSG